MKMSRDPTKCPNPNCVTDLDKHTELRKQLCQNEYIKYLMKKWAITGLVVACSIFFFINTMPAYAINVTSVSLDDNQIPVVVPSGSPAIVQTSSGLVHGTMTTEGQPEQVTSSNLNDFVYQETRTADGSFNVEFDGILDNHTGTINLVQDGSVSYSLVLEPQTMKVASPETGLAIPTWVYAVGVAGGCAVGLVLWRRREED
jgi:hypothetical protein